MCVKIKFKKESVLMLTPKHETVKKNRTRLYCEPQVKSFLTEKWLHMNFWDEIFFLPYLLSQFGLSGSTTAFWGNEDNTVSFVYEKNKVKTFRFFKKQDTINNCIIPGYEDEYTPSFAVAEYKEDCKKFYFYLIDDLEWCCYPRFCKEFRSSGTLCKDTNEADFLRVTFQVEKPSVAKLSCTVIINNDKQSEKIIDAYADTILNILNTEKSKSVYKQYEKISKFIGHITSNYIFSFENSEGIITDELVISNNKTEKFMVSDDSKTITVYKDHNWDIETKYYHIKSRDKKISYSGDIDELLLSKISSFKDIVDNTKRFIAENMWFAFNE